MASDLCPYCGNQLKKLPKRKAKCKECGGQIFVLEDQELFPSSLLTKDDALAVEYCEVMEFSKSEFENEKARLRQGFGQDPSSRDVMRGLFNGLVVKHIANFEGLVRTYGGHANYERDIGDDFTEQLQLCNKIRLLLLKKEGVSYVKTNYIAGVQYGTRCESCQELTNEIFSVDEALETTPLPNPNCTSIPEGGSIGFCTCWYGEFTPDLASKEDTKRFLKKYGK